MTNKATGIRLRRKGDPEPRPPCAHAEALCLMKYRSEKSGRVEWLWNSRDGVTPFGINDPTAEGDSYDNLMNHADWGEDVFVPNFVPPVGMRVFMSWGDAPERVKAEVRAAWEKRAEGAPLEVAERMKAAPPFEYEDPSPVIVLVDDELHQHFRRLAEEDPFVSPQAAPMAPISRGGREP